MKRFQFPLGRVLDWRRLQARIAENRLDALLAEGRALAAADRAKASEQAEAEGGVRSGAATGQELAALDAFRKRTAAERERIAKERSANAQKVNAQMRVAAQRRRDVKLLEKIRGQRFEAWTREAEREIEQQAEEAHASRQILGRRALPGQSRQDG
jgi:hypothetical protein